MSCTHIIRWSAAEKRLALALAEMVSLSRKIVFSLILLSLFLSLIHGLEALDSKGSENGTLATMKFSTVTHRGRRSKYPPKSRHPYCHHHQHHHHNYCDDESTASRSLDFYLATWLIAAAYEAGFLLML